MADLSQPAKKIRPAWVQLAPFALGGLLLSLAVPLLPTASVTGPSYQLNLASSLLSVGLAIVVVAVASYLGARWSGRRRPDLVAIIATGAGAAVLAVPGISAPSLWIVVAAAIAVRPPSPVAYPARFGFGVFLAYIVPWVFPTPVAAVVVPLVGIWIADRLIDHALGARKKPPAALRSLPAGAAVGGASGAMIGMLLGIAAIFVSGVVETIAPKADPTAVLDGDLGLALFGVVLWIGVIGAGLGLLTGPFLARSKRRTPSARRS